MLLTVLLAKLLTVMTTPRSVEAFVVVVIIVISKVGGLHCMTTPRSEEAFGRCNGAQQNPHANPHANPHSTQH